MNPFARQVYLDHNATTPICRAARKAMRHAVRSIFGNPSALYRTGHMAREILEESRAAVALALGVVPTEFIFTGCASEANNQVLTMLFEHFYPDRRALVISPIEHPSVIATARYLETRGAELRWMRTGPTGIVDVDHYASLLDSSVFLVSCMLANNETGTIQDVARMAAMAHDQDILFHSDCVQALGKIPLALKSLGVDYASFSAHKINGPKGIGALYAASGVPVRPWLHGGHQEHGLRAGTESLHNIAGFAAAARVLSPERTAAHCQTVTRMLADGIRAIKNDAVFNTPESEALPNTLSVTFPGINNALLVALLDYYGICVAPGSACSTPENNPSHVLTALGLSADAARETIRFSTGAGTTQRDIRYTLRIIRNFIEGRTVQVGMVNPSFLDLRMLNDPHTYILDIRDWYDKLSAASLPGAHEASVFLFHRYLHAIPRNRHIILVCQTGVYSPVFAFYLRKKGYTEVSFLVSGMAGWKAAQPALYAAHAGRDIITLKRR